MLLPGKIKSFCLTDTLGIQVNVNERDIIHQSQFFLNNVIRHIPAKEEDILSSIKSWL